MPDRKLDGGKSDLAVRAGRTSGPPCPGLEPGQTSGVPAWAPTVVRITPCRALTGRVRLSLVTCPIELFPATSQAEKTHFHQITRKTAIGRRGKACGLTPRRSRDTHKTNWENRGVAAPHETKPIEEEKLIRVPHTLDLTPYRAAAAAGEERR